MIFDTLLSRQLFRYDSILQCLCNFTLECNWCSVAKLIYAFLLLFSFPIRALILKLEGES